MKWCLLTLITFVSTSLLAHFSVSPLVLEFNAHPGEDQTRTLHIENKRSEPLNLKLYVSDYLPKKKGLEKELPPGSITHSCAKWISFSEKGYIHLAPHSSKELQVSIQVPKNSNGLYWSKIFLEEEILSPSKKNPQGVHFSVLQRWEVRVYEKVPNTSFSKAEISHLKILHPEGSNPLSIDMTLTNSGNALLKGVGEVLLLDKEGEVIRSYPIENDLEFTCYPQSERTFQVPILDTIPKGPYTVRAKIYYGSGKVLVRETQFSFPRKVAANQPSLVIHSLGGDS